MQIFLGEDEQSDNKANGYTEKSYALKGVGAVKLRYPRDRKGEFESSVIPKRERVDPRLQEDMAVLHLAGISNRTLGMISRRILGVDVSKDTIQRSLGIIEESATKWLTRDISDEYWCLYIDGTNFSIRRKGATERSPSLVVLGVDKSNHRSVLAIDPGTRDNVDCWRSVFSELIKRGLNPQKVQIGVMDGLPGLERAFCEYFPKAVTARCWTHASKNALNRCSKSTRALFKSRLQKIMYAKSKAEAKNEWNALKANLTGSCNRGIQIIEKDLDSLLRHYEFDQRFWRALRTTNPIERVNKELKRRVKSMEGVGERTLECLVAFTALRLEMGWRLYTIDDQRHENLERLYKVETNQIEDAIVELIQ